MILEDVRGEYITLILAPLISIIFTGERYFLNFGYVRDEAVDVSVNLTCLAIMLVFELMIDTICFTCEQRFWGIPVEEMYQIRARGVMPSSTTVSSDNHNASHNDDTTITNTDSNLNPRANPVPNLSDNPSLIALRLS